MRAVVDVADVAPYLMGRGLLGGRAVVDGRLRIADVSRKNRVFLVTAQDMPCYVIKLSNDRRDTSVAREAAVLERLSASPLADLVPKAIAYDDATGVLVLETPAGARDLAQHHGGARFSQALARQTGRSLALLHAMPPQALDGLEAVDPGRLLAVHRLDLETMRTLTSAGQDLVRLVQNSDELCRRLDDLLESAPRDAVIHGDARWDNWLALSRDGTTRRTRVLMLDWELAAAGDPAFDVGSILAEYLRAWKRYAAIPDPRELGRRRVHPDHALPRMRPAVRAFWDAYSAGRSQPAGRLNEFLTRALQFAGSRLVLAALEEAQTRTELDKYTLVTLQLGASVLERPEDAGTMLLGLPAIPKPV